MFTAWFWLMLITALIDWIGSWQGWQKIRWYSKPFTLIWLIVWFTQIGHWQGPLVWFGLGLTFSLIGDVLLHIPHPRFFVPGGIAFFLAHISYITGFFQSPLALDARILLPLVGVGGLFLWGRVRLIRVLKQRQNTPDILSTTLYTFMLSFMWFSALSTLLRPQWALTPALLVSLGGGAFFLSDSLLIHNRYIGALPKSDFWVMLTYHAGQILLASGALAQFSGI